MSFNNLSQKQQDSVLAGLLDRPIAFQRSFVALGVGITGALMLSQAIYWSKRTKDGSGWFYKTIVEWEEETGLTRHEQDRARRSLRNLGIFIEELKGAPARLYFKVDFNALYRALLGDVKESSLDDVITNFSSSLNSLSRTGLMRAKKLNVAAVFVSYADVLKRDGMICSCCKEPIVYGLGQFDEALSFDYIIPLSKGGSHTACNISPAHYGCNLKKWDIENRDNESKKTEHSKDSYPKQSSLLNLDKLGCLTKANKPAYPKQTPIYTETTTETTTDIIGQSNVMDDAFNLFWFNCLLPKKAKQNARKSFEKAVKLSKQDPTEFAHMIVENIKSRIKSKHPSDFGFEKMHPTTYLNQQRWLDEVSQSPKKHTGLNATDAPEPNHADWLDD